MAEWLKALVSKTGIPFTGYRGFESPFFRGHLALSVLASSTWGYFFFEKMHLKCTDE